MKFWGLFGILAAWPNDDVKTTAARSQNFPAEKLVIIWGFNGNPGKNSYLYIL